ncbi:MAG: phosphatase PAP2 family protein [Candidatus Helarchaeota archaeon]
MNWKKDLGDEMQEHEDFTIERFKNKSNLYIIIGLVCSFVIFLLLVLILTDPVIVISVNPTVAQSANPFIYFANVFYMVLSDYLSYVYIVVVIVLFFLSYVEIEKLEFLQLKKYRYLLLIALVSGCLTQICVNSLKVLIARERPYVTFPDLLNNFSRLSMSYSFPSGHTGAVFGFLLPIILFQDKYWKKLVILTVPIAVGFSRLYLGVHYLSDVIGGMIIGISFVIISSVIIIKTRNMQPQKISKQNLYLVLATIILIVFLATETLL